MYGVCDIVCFIHVIVIYVILLFYVIAGFFLLLFHLNKMTEPTTDRNSLE